MNSAKLAKIFAQNDDKLLSKHGNQLNYLKYMQKRRISLIFESFRRKILDFFSWAPSWALLIFFERERERWTQRKFERERERERQGFFERERERER